MFSLRSIRVRLTLWYVVLLAVTLTVFSAVVYLALRESLYSNLDESLEDRAEVVAGLVIDDGELSVEGAQLPSDPIEGEEFTRVYDASGQPVAETFVPEPVATDEGSVRAALEGERRIRGEEAGGVELRVMVSPIRAGDRIIGALEVGSEDEVGDTLNAFLFVLVIAYPLALLAAAAGGTFLANRALSPIDDVTRAATRISGEDLSRRLNLDLPDDEVGRLARTFDEMIARLDEAFRRQREFTADASHELRTPLTAIKGQTEVALQRERSPAEYQDALRAVNSDVDRMIRLVGSLLTLARADARQIPLARDTVSLGELVRDAVEQVRPAATEKGLNVNVHTDGDVRFTADEDLLLQLALNLLDNAVKHTPEGGRIDVRTGVVDGSAEVSVSDSGPGIAAEHLSRIFDRFYRVDPARTHGGVGLGLSISRWIAEVHGGTLDVRSMPGEGSTFTARLPLH